MNIILNTGSHYGDTSKYRASFWISATDGICPSTRWPTWILSQNMWCTMHIPHCEHFPWYNACTGIRVCFRHNSILITEYFSTYYIPYITYRYTYTFHIQTFISDQFNSFQQWVRVNDHTCYHYAYINSSFSCKLSLICQFIEVHKWCPRTILIRFSHI